MATHQIIALAGLMFVAPAPVSAQEAPLAWLVGQWCTESQLGKATCENLSSPHRVVRVDS